MRVVHMLSLLSPSVHRHMLVSLQDDDPLNIQLPDLAKAHW
jgi:hypothetical protein